MSDEYEWGPWTQHAQGAQPVPSGTMVQAEMGYIDSGDYVGPLRAEDFDWRCYGDPVTAYRVRKPRAMTQLREMVETLPAPERAKEMR